MPCNALQQMQKLAAAFTTAAWVTDHVHVCMHRVRSEARSMSNCSETQTTPNMSNLKNDNFIWLRFLHNVASTPFSPAAWRGPWKTKQYDHTALLFSANINSACVGVWGKITYKTRTLHKLHDNNISINANTTSAPPVRMFITFAPRLMYVYIHDIV